MTNLTPNRHRSLRRPFVAAVTLAVAFVLAASTVGTWKPVAKRWKWFVVGTNMYQDLLRRTHLRADQIGQGDGPRRTSADLPREIDAIDKTFDGYLRYSLLSADALYGKRVLELGPGDNIGVALRFAAAGAPFVSAVDKFVPLQDDEYHRTLYRSLRARLTPDEQRRFDEAIEVDTHVAPRGDRLQYVYGRQFEKSDTYTPNSFDLIVSNAVLEEIYDIDQAFAGMDRLLRPGGYLLHKIDLGDYGMFTKHGFPALEFLTVPDAVYQRMVESSGQPNRRLVDYYRAKTGALGYDTTIYTTSVLGNPTELIPHKVSIQQEVDYSDHTRELIQAIRPRLLSRYQRLSDADLMVQGIYLVARKSAVEARVASKMTSSSDE
jgi:SAM-dependent methyltransferase